MTSVVRPTPEREKFRKGIVAVIRSKEGLLLCERSDILGSWQFPQGGVEANETEEEAFFREVTEELGNGHCRILIRGDRLVRYRWPQAGRDGLHGQEQLWFLAEFYPGAGPDLAKSDCCFRDWKWVSPEQALNSVVSWKRAAYAEGLASIKLLPLAVDFGL